jgi:hypothetical protein
MGKCRLPKIICECGAEATLGHLQSPVHRNSVRHRHHKRIRTLLMKPCVTLSEIGTRLRITGERARQIALGYGFHGFSRRHLCTLRRADEFFKIYFRKLILVCPFSANLIKTSAASAQYMFSRSNVTINGHVCFVSRGAGKRPDGKIIWMRAIKQSTLASCEFVICEIQRTKDYLIVPSHLWHQTGFVLNPDTRYGAKSDFHGWRNYINAWHLLESQPASEN